MTRHGKASASSIPINETPSGDRDLPIAGTSTVPDPDYITIGPNFTESRESDITGSTQQSNNNQSEGNTFAGAAVGRIETVIDSFRTGKANKCEVMYRIGQILTAEPSGTESQNVETYERYAATLDGIETLAAQSAEHGSQIANPLLGKRKEGVDRGSGRHAEPDRDPAANARENDVNNFLDKISRENQHGVDDENDSGGESDGESRDGSEYGSKAGERGRSNKKQRIYESQMPWFSAEQQARRIRTDPSCNKTRDALEIFQRDPTTVKRWIRCAASAPPGFPSSEWDSLIKGESVDLDVVFSSLHHIHSVDEGIGRVGATEIQFGKPKPAAKVETSGQWTSAYNLVVKATAFLFPHRYEELRQYGDYIEELFSAKSVSIHPRLFKYDEAVRYKVGQGQNLLLTDRGAFTRYYEAIVAPDGIGAEGKGGGSKANQKKGGKPGEKSDICHQFNGANGCSNAVEKCKYKHICKKCKSSGHGKVDCKITETV